MASPTLGRKWSYNQARLSGSHVELFFQVRNKFFRKFVLGDKIFSISPEQISSEQNSNDITLLLISLRGRKLENLVLCILSISYSIFVQYKLYKINFKIKVNVNFDPVGKEIVIQKAS